MANPVTQLSLVACYGEKDSNALWTKIGELQSLIQSEIPDVFEPYEQAHIHGTIIGLEGFRRSGELLGKNYKQIQNKNIKLDIEAVINFVLETSLLPMQIKFSGFNNANVNFTSRGETPANRCISIQGDIIVMMGWPHTHSCYSPQLDTLRRRLSRFGALHKYYVAPNSYDNDFFLVLGTLKSPLGEERSANLLSRLRKELDSWENITIELSTENICLVQYEDTKLRKARPIKLSEASAMIKTLEQGYPEEDMLVNNT